MTTFYPNQPARFLCILLNISVHLCLMMPLLCNKHTLMWIDPWFKLWTLWGRQKLTLTQPLILRRTEPVAHKLKKTRTNERNEKCTCPLIDDTLGRNIVSWKHHKMTLEKKKHEKQRNIPVTDKMFLKFLKDSWHDISWALESPTWLAWYSLRTNNWNNGSNSVTNTANTPILFPGSIFPSPFHTPIKSDRDAGKKETLGMRLLLYYNN